LYSISVRPYKKALLAPFGSIAERVLMADKAIAVMFPAKEHFGTLMTLTGCAADSN